MDKPLPDISEPAAALRPDNAERDRQICAAIAAGASLAEAAKPWGITRQMAGQIYRRARAAQQEKESSVC